MKEQTGWLLWAEQIGLLAVERALSTMYRTILKGSPLQNHDFEYVDEDEF